MYKAIIVVAALIWVAFLGLVVYLGLFAYTPRFTDENGSEIAGSIATLEKVTLGGMEQWILIRGEERRRPVLLWLHGGPGAPQMPLAHRLDAALEDHFVVVHWDQRGAGKSNPRDFNPQTMQFEQYLADARELTEYLQRRLSADRIMLLGHSWGTQLGMELVHRYPHYFLAYIGVSQVVDHERATEIAHDWLQQAINPQEAPEDWHELQQIEIPARRHSDYRRLNALTDAYGGSMDLSLVELARIAAAAPEYTALDYPRLLRGMSRGGGPMHPNGIMAAYNFLESIPAVEVPVFFLSGARDYNTPLLLVQEYYELITAPQKELIVFEHSAHLPFLAEPEKFSEQVIRIGLAMENSASKP